MNYQTSHILNESHVGLHLTIFRFQFPSRKALFSLSSLMQCAVLCQCRRQRRPPVGVSATAFTDQEDRTQGR